MSSHQGAEDGPTAISGEPTASARSLPPLGDPHDAAEIPPPLSIPPQPRPYTVATSNGRRTTGGKARSKTPLSWRRPESRESIMFQARQARIKAEEDVKLLMNRLKHLKFEEEKTRRRIEETEARAREVMTLKKNHQVFKVDFRIKRQETWKRKAERDKITIHRVNDGRKSKLKEIRDKIVTKKKETAVEIRHMRQKMAEDLIKAKTVEEVKHREKCLEIRRQREEMRKKKEEAWVKLNEKLAEEYASKVACEARKAAEAEELARRLEEEEMVLIERLRKAQESQRAAYETLQTSIIHRGR